MKHMSVAEVVMADGVAYCTDDTTVVKDSTWSTKAVAYGWGGAEAKVEFAVAKFCMNGPRSGANSSYFAGMQVPWFEGQEMMPHEQQKAEKAAKKAMKAAKKAAENK